MNSENVNSTEGTVVNFGIETRGLNTALTGVSVCLGQLEVLWNVRLAQVEEDLMCVTGGLYAECFGGIQRMMYEGRDRNARMLSTLRSFAEGLELVVRFYECADDDILNEAIRFRSGGSDLRINAPEHATPGMGVQPVM